ncbi:MAG: efflux RND transporter periplasmic adaptor subunit [Magnetococcales bacterium]|nr:efflux RND transporter periplasmic adaptor subunit [Magnetococcales bacterium]
MPGMSYTLKRTLSLLLLTAALLADGRPLQAAPPAAVLTVQTVSPQTHTWEVLEKSSGNIAPWQESIVAAEIGGLAIVELAVDVGSVVQKGQRLLRLSQTGIQASLAQHRANVAKAKASLAEAVANAKRARAVTGSGALSEQQIKQYLTAEAVGRATLQAAEAALQMEEVRLQQTTLCAADAGIISSRSATLGSVVQPGVELFRLVRQGRLEWRAELTAEQLLQVQVGQKARVRLSDGQELAGVVRLLAPTLDAGTRKAIAYVDLPTDSPARAGMFAQGEIIVSSAPALVLPHAAVVLRDGHSYVFQVIGIGEGEHPVVKQRKVTTGRRNGDWVEIRAGLGETAQVVASGGAFLKQGDRVQLTDAPTDQPATTP